MNAQRAYQFIEHLKNVLLRSEIVRLMATKSEGTHLKLMYQHCNEIHEIDQFRRFKMSQKVGH